MPPDSRGRRLYGIVDQHRGRSWVTDEGEPVTFPTDDSAEGWIDRQRYLDG